MPTRIEIYSKIKDSRATQRKTKLLDTFTRPKKISDVFLADVYTVDKEFSEKDLQKIGEMLINPVTHEFIIRHSEQSEESHSKNKEKFIGKKGSFAFAQDDKQFSFAIEIGFLPGVTDNVAHTVKESIEDLLKERFSNGENVYVSQVTFLTGDLTQKDAEEISLELHNPLIQRASIKSFNQYRKDGGMDNIIPKVTLGNIQNTVDVDITVLDDEYMSLLGKQGICYPNGLRKGPLALDVTFLKAIQAYFKKKGRHPTDIELESIAQTWSEHCKHTIFSDPIDDIEDGLYNRYIKKATEEIRRKKGKNDFCVSVFTDNSGAVVFDDTYLITHKVETHNTPSALDPFGGSITGIVGVNRDAIGFGLGAKPIANFYGFCFANPYVDKPLYKGKNSKQKMLPSRRIMEGVIAGVNAGGNQSGIPTPQGFVYFDEKYRGKPLVFVGTAGLIPIKTQRKESFVKKAQSGDYIVMVGGRVGKDGIHGATFSSEAMDSGSPATAVQIGDPITQKKLSDALVKEARDLLLYTSITDNGAGGLSCSVAEMAKESGGCLVELEKVPLKYPGLEPWEIWVSEAQERMTLSVPQKKWKEFSTLMKKRGVEATIIGEFTHSGKCIVTYFGKEVMNIDMDFLHDGLPQRPMVSKAPSHISLSVQNVSMKDSKIKEPKDYSELLVQMLKRQNIGSYEFISQQYDHIVQSNLVLGPLQGRGRINADASVIRPVLTSQKGVCFSQGLYPSYSEIDPYAMAAASIDSAIRNIVATGAPLEKIALLDNFCWCSATDPQRLYQLKLSAKACYDLATFYETPFISGKDSMFNDFKGYDSTGADIKISIPPTLLISSLAVIDTVEKVVSLDTKFPGDYVYILGETFDEIGGSEYIEFLSNGNISTRIPKVWASKNKKLYTTFQYAIQKDLIASAISVGRGGLGVALAKTALGGLLGIDISLQNLAGKTIRDDFALFSESQGRILVTVAPQHQKEFEKLFSGISHGLLGTVTQSPTISIKGLKNKQIIQTTVEELLRSYRQPFGKWL